MYERALKPTSRSVPAQRASGESPSTAPAPGPAALPRLGFASLAVHPPSAAPSQARPLPNRTGLPDRLKGGVERLSGVSLDGVKVHYNSPRPARIEALAYAQGRDIHLAPGQEHHLPHEAWHLVQQAQGRVKPTMQLKDGVQVNDESGLEREADVMGARALRGAAPLPAPVHSRKSPSSGDAPVLQPVLKGGTPPMQLNGKEKRLPVKAISFKGSTAKRREAQKARIKDDRAEELNTRRRYHVGQHGAKKAEQARLSNALGISVTGDTHESEHTIGFEPLNRTSGLARGTSGRAKTLENIAPAYQEVKALHRDHIGTGTSATPDASGFTSQSYRDSQRSLVEAGDVSSAVQLNQLGYAFDPNFRPSLGTGEGKAASNSFDTMVQNMKTVTYAQDDLDVEVPVDAKAQAEMHLSRRAAETGSFPTPDEENEARRKFGLPELP